MNYEKFLEFFDNGLKLKNKGIPITNYKKIGKETANIQKGRYWIVGGSTSTGKTSFVDDIFVIDTYEWFIKEKPDIKLNFIYNSMERPEVSKLAKWSVLKLFKDTGKLISPNVLSGQINEEYENQMQDFEFIKKNRLLIHSYKPYFDEMFKIMDFYSGSCNPTGIYKRCESFAFKHGVKKQKEHGWEYIPNTENHYVIIVNDHVGKISSESGLNDKGVLDKHSEYMGILRDKFLFIPIDIYQFNRGVNDTQRKSNSELYPNMSDFKGSSDGLENCDFAIALFNPYKHGIKNFNGYDINSFVGSNGENRFRSISLLKNSYGTDDIDFGLGFIGEVGKFYDLPVADELKSITKRVEIEKMLFLEKQKLNIKQWSL